MSSDEASKFILSEIQKEHQHQQMALHIAKVERHDPNLSVSNPIEHSTIYDL